MDRSKRAIKTPKRFDDEAFVTPPKHPHQQKQAVEVSTAKVAPQDPTPTPTKSIIKVKLGKIKPRPAVKETIKSPPQEPIPTKSDIKVELPKIKLTKSSNKETIKTPVQESTPTKSNVKVEVAKPKPKQTVKEPVSKPVTPDRSGEIHAFVYRPKMKRPRTPPVYVDLVTNVVLPFWDARTAAEEHEDDNVKELVHCHCGVVEELGLMIQCETCLTWQHAHCLGFENPEDVPDGYTCKACSDPRYARESMKWAYDQDWLIKGRLKQFKLAPITDKKDGLTEKNVDLLRRTNQLIGNILNIDKIVHGLKIKRKILLEADDEDPQLKVFNFQWPASYQHSDGSHFVPNSINPPSTPASTISVIAETSDLGDITVETVADCATLPDIGQLEDVSAILDAPYVSNTQTLLSSSGVQQTSSNNDQTPMNDCRSNLKLHIQQTEEFIGIELAHFEEQVSALEKEYSETLNSEQHLIMSHLTLESLKEDLQTIKRYICEHKLAAD